MKQRCRRQQPSPPSQVLRRAPFWVLFFLSFFFFYSFFLVVYLFVCVCVFVSACVCVSGCNSSKDGVSVCSCPLRALLCVPLPSIVNSCLLVHSWLMVGGWSGDVCVCLWGLGGVGKGWSYPTTSHSPFFIGGEGGDWRVYRRRFGEERKVSCARRFLCSYWWADSQWGGDGRCLKLHLLSVTLLALQLQDTSLCFATTKRKKKGELHGWSLKTAARLDQETHFLLSPTWTGSFLQFSSGYKTFNFLFFPLKGNRAILLGLVLTTLLGHFLF